MSQWVSLLFPSHLSHLFILYIFQPITFISFVPVADFFIAPLSLYIFPTWPLFSYTTVPYFPLLLFICTYLFALYLSFNPFHFFNPIMFPPLLPVAGLFSCSFTLSYLPAFHVHTCLLLSLSPVYLYLYLPLLKIRIFSLWKKIINYFAAFTGHAAMLFSLL